MTGGFVLALAAGTLPAAPAWAEKRVALVIGNSAYISAGKLANPRKDAERMMQVLKALNFEVLGYRDADLKQMKSALNRFSDLLSRSGPDTVALVYYAGHGVQVRGENYLLPVDATIKNEGDVDVESVRSSSIMEIIDSVKTGLNIVILDACRNNPFAFSRAATRGLARMEAPRGTLIAFSTSPGKTATDGPADGNSPYTAALARALISPGVKIEDVFKNVRKDVDGATKGEQTPWELSSLVGDFFPAGEAPVGALPAALSAPSTPVIEASRPLPPKPPEPAISAPPPPPSASQNCTLDARQTHIDDAGRVTVTLTSNCAFETISIRYRDWAFVRRLPANSRQHQLLFDLFQGAAPLTFDIGGSAVATVAPSIPSTLSVVKFALMWDATVDLDLHVLQNAARPGEINDVWTGNPRLLADARSGQTGFISFSEPGQHLQVYTLIKSSLQRIGTLQVRVDFTSRGARATEPYCGSSSLASVGYKIVHFESGQQEKRPGLRSTNRKPCGAALSENERYESPMSMVKF